MRDIKGRTISMLATKEQIVTADHFTAVSLYGLSHVSLKCARSMVNYRLEIARDGLSGTEVLNKRSLTAICTDGVASNG